MEVDIIVLLLFLPFLPFALPFMLIKWLFSLVGIDIF